MIRKSNHRSPFMALLVLMAIFTAVLGKSGDPRDFWLDVLHSSPGSHHGMVCAFITSAEYQRRFSSVITHGNRALAGSC